jgi:3-dehydroquinate dehydratase type I
VIVASLGARPLELEPAPGGLDGIDAVELRLDLLGLSTADLAPVMAQATAAAGRVVVTCRPGRMPEDARVALLLEGIRQGAWGVDVEVDAPEASRRAVIGGARRAGRTVIVSHHDHERTPPREALRQVIDAGFVLGADIVKIACRVTAPGDNARLLGLLGDGRPAGRLAVLGMGSEGWLTRVAAPLLGSALTYVALRPGLETADGQPTLGDLRRAWSVLEPRAVAR